MEYDVIIVGAGPAGMFAAHEIAKNSRLKVLVIEMGKDIEERKCPVDWVGECIKCKPCHIMSGVGGAGGLSDGTLNLRPDIGGDLTEFVGNSEAWKLVDHVDSIFLQNGAPKKVYEPTSEEAERLSRKAAAAGIEFVQIRQRHIGTDYTPKVLSSLSKGLLKKGVKFLVETRVRQLKKTGVQLKGGKVLEAKYLLLAPGRGGAPWLAEQAKKVGIKTRHAPLDIGARVEVPAMLMDSITNTSRDPKFRIMTRTYDDHVRTFCVNPRGFVVKENYNDYVGVNGHALRDRESQNTNFAFLTTIKLTEPIENTTAYGESIAKIATTLGGGKPLVQRMGDIRKGRRSTWSRIDRNPTQPTLKAVTPGDIAMAMPHRVVANTVEGLEKLDEVIPGVASDSTLLYAPEIKFYATRVEVKAGMETGIDNIFVAGDGAGVSRDIVNAAATGIIAARGILKKEGINP